MGSNVNWAFPLEKDCSLAIVHLRGRRWSRLSMFLRRGECKLRFWTVEISRNLNGHFRKLFSISFIFSNCLLEMTPKFWSFTALFLIRCFLVDFLRNLLILWRVSSCYRYSTALICRLLSIANSLWCLVGNPPTSSANLVISWRNCSILQHWFQWPLKILIKLSLLFDCHFWSARFMDLIELSCAYSTC